MAISSIARMNLAALDGDILRELRKFFIHVRDHGTEEGASRAPAWLEAINNELSGRTGDTQ